LVATKAGLQKLGLKNTVSFSEPCVAEEQGHRYSDQPYLGDGLSNAVHSVLSNAHVSAPIEHLFSTINGESFGSKEMGVMMSRNSGAFAENVQTHHPADCFGDIGAAFAPALVGLAAYNLARQKIQGAVLVTASSDSQYRGAMCLKTQFVDAALKESV
jgi:3-oxoacyl-[acyl-carrier-protein] synthase-1